MEIYTVLQDYFRIFENIIQDEHERWRVIIIKTGLNMIYAASMTGLWCRFSVLPFLVIR